MKTQKVELELEENTLVHLVEFLKHYEIDNFFESARAPTSKDVSEYSERLRKHQYNIRDIENALSELEVQEESYGATKC